MTGCGTITLTDPRDFGVYLPGSVDLVLTGSRHFRARLAWLRAARLWVTQVEESAPRIAFLSPPPDSILVSFALCANPAVVWNGVALRPGQLVLHGAGDRFHQRIAGTARWSMALVPRSILQAFGRALLGSDLALPEAESVHAPSAAIARFQRLHAQACRLAQSRPDVASHPEAMRALEQELLHALVNTLTGKLPQDSDLRRRRHAGTMGRLERVLASCPDRTLSMSDLCAAIGVPERTLRMHCMAFLGMSPLSYVRLRRLNLARQALLRAERGMAGVGTVARRYGFSELGRFAATYRAVFGEAPSATLRKAANEDSLGRFRRP